VALRKKDTLFSPALFLKRISLILAVTFLALILLFLVAAVGENSTVTADGDGSLCANCHQDQTRLESLSDRWKGVYIDPDQYYREAIHSGLECTTCHGGNPTKDDPHEACIDIAEPNPAATDVVQETCGASNCHPDTTARHLKSLHVTLNGIHTSLIHLLGETDGTAKFQESCNSCHASCAECHMEEPGRHGLLFPKVENHNFAPEPDTRNCWSCHGGTGDTFFGEPGNEAHGPSAMAEAGMRCMDCHSEPEVHGDGAEPTFIIEAAPKPECEDCHDNPERVITIGARVAVAPQHSPTTAAHQIHLEEEISCVSCHTEWYPNCWNCHEGREERASYELFLANNPVSGKIHTAVHSPAAGPDWGGYSPEVGGGWAIKSRHSWGDPHTCEKCHTDPRVYIEGLDREARFVGGWNEAEKGASYIDESRIAQLVIDQESLQAGVHQDIPCEGCHQTLTEDICTGCHLEQNVEIPLGDDWSYTPYIEARENLEQAEQLLAAAEQFEISKVSTWHEDWLTVRETYRQTANDFHSKPGRAQAAMEQIAANSQELLASVQMALNSQETNWRRLIFGLPLLVGLAGAVGIIGLSIYRPKNK
jgi:hypothetical protein